MLTNTQSKVQNVQLATNKVLTKRNFTIVAKTRVVQDKSEKIVRERDVRVKEKVIPVFNTDRCERVGEIDRLLSQLMKKFSINAEEPIMKVLFNLVTVKADDRLILKRVLDDHTNPPTECSES